MDFLTSRGALKGAGETGRPSPSFEADLAALKLVHLHFSLFQAASGNGVS